MSNISFDFNRNLPRRTTTVGKYTIHYFPFECDKHMLEDGKFFNFALLLCMGTAEERKFGPKEIELDLEEVLVQTTLCTNKQQAKKLIEDGSIGIGEPPTGTRKITDKILKIFDPYNALITLNRANVDWVFITFEK